MLGIRTHGGIPVTTMHNFHLPANICARCVRVCVRVYANNVGVLCAQGFARRTQRSNARICVAGSMSFVHMLSWIYRIPDTLHGAVAPLSRTRDGTHSSSVYARAAHTLRMYRHLLIDVTSIKLIYKSSTPPPNLPIRKQTQLISMHNSARAWQSELKHKHNSDPRAHKQRIIFGDTDVSREHRCVPACRPKGFVHSWCVRLRLAELVRAMDFWRRFGFMLSLSGGCRILCDSSGTNMLTHFP